MTRKEFDLLQCGDLISSRDIGSQNGHLLYRCCDKALIDPITHHLSIRLEMNYNHEQVSTLTEYNIDNFMVLDYFKLTHKTALETK